MSKAELVESIVAKSKEPVNAKQADAMVNAFVDAIKAAMLKGDKVTLQGFGTFEVVEKEAAQRRNPRTGETFTAPAHKAPKFKFSGSMKDLFL